MAARYRFDRQEFSGSLGDLGTLLPLGVGMILINGLDPIGLFFSIGAFYILSGLFYGVTVPIQPMKVVGAYAIATGLEASQILASGALMFLILFIIGATGAIVAIGKWTPKSVVRGVQLSTGVLLMVGGLKLVIGTSKFQALHQAVEPYLSVQSLGPIPIGIVIGAVGGILTLLLLESKRFPAGLLVVLGGMIIGGVLGTHEGFDRLQLGINLPKILPFGFPSGADFSLALLLLVLPQTPMTLGNAVIAYADLSKEYFGEASKKVTYRSACITMSLANLVSFLVGGMPVCYGAGGLAAHYRFGARTAGSNILIGGIFVFLALLFGAHALSIVYLIPMSVLGILLVFAGSQLALTVIDMKNRKDLFVTLIILGITLASNLAVGFIAGIVVAHILKSEKFSV